jgi:hypothetical protein
LDWRRTGKMREATARFARQTKSGGFFAEVSVEVEPAAQPSVTIKTEGEGFRRQGTLESVPAEGYEDWRAGAVIGARFALRVAEVAAVVLITRISGLSTDTNPSIVAAAAALAVWKALGVQPQPEAREQVEQVAFESWKNSPTALPVLT